MGAGRNTSPFFFNIYKLQPLMKKYYRISLWKFGVTAVLGYKTIVAESLEDARNQARAIFSKSSLYEGPLKNWSGAERVQS